MPSETVLLDLPPQPRKVLVAHGGSEVVLSPSVYDVPQAATIDWDASLRVLRVTFRYVDEEKATEHKTNDLTLYTGQNSQKLIGLSLKVKGAEQVTDELTQGVDQQIQRATRDNQRLNYALVRDALVQTLAPFLMKFVRLAAV